LTIRGTSAADSYKGAGQFIDMQSEKQRIIKRFIKGYLSLFAMMLFVLTVSLIKGAGWKILLVGAPLFVTLFLGITYQLAKEMRGVKRQNSTFPK
jgi:hypothetical protein